MFQAGDRVRCISIPEDWSNTFGLVIGTVYTVDEAWEEPQGLYLKELTNMVFPHDLFELEINNV
jgi:hypothetical protein